MNPAPDLSLGPGVTDARYNVKECKYADFDDTCSYGASTLNVIQAKADHSNYFNVKVSDFGKGGCVNPCIRGGTGGSKRRKREPMAVNEEIGESNRSKRALGINCRGSWCCDDGLVPSGFNTPDKMEELLHNAKNPDRKYKSGEHIVCIPTPSCATVCKMCFQNQNEYC